MERGRNIRPEPRHETQKVISLRFPLLDSAEGESGEERQEGQAEQSRLAGDGEGETHMTPTFLTTSACVAMLRVFDFMHFFTSMRHASRCEPTKHRLAASSRLEIQRSWLLASILANRVDWTHASTGTPADPARLSGEAQEGGRDRSAERVHGQPKFLRWQGRLVLMQ
jgi:hypothetical protein